MEFPRIPKPSVFAACIGLQSCATNFLPGPHPSKPDNTLGQPDNFRHTANMISKKSANRPEPHYADILLQKILFPALNAKNKL